MVEFHLPEEIDKQYMELIHLQRLKVKHYFDQKILLSYTLSYKLHKLWAIFVGRSKEEVEQFILDLPLTKYMDYEIHDLMFHESTELALPTFSLN
jgi:muconolactone delta-isomerase